MTSVKSSYWYSDLLKGVQAGGPLMLVQTPLVNALNRVSVVACYKNAPLLTAISAVYRGAIDNASSASILHFFKGVGGHLVKETLRLSFKASGLVLKPRITRFYEGAFWGKTKADLTFAGLLAGAEMAINPADTLRTMWQAGKRIRDISKGTKITHLYKGSLANGVRQFGTWFFYSMAERFSVSFVKKTTSLDPYSLPAIALRALPESFFLSSPVWFFERIKNELQYHPKLSKNPLNSSRYWAACQHIYTAHGWVGFCRGFVPKVLSNAILAAGADYIVGLAKRD